MSAPLSPARAVLLVAGREIRVQLRSRTFFIGLIVTLVLFGGVGLLTTFISSQAESNSLALTPATASLRPAIEAVAAAQGADVEISEIDEEAGRAAVADDEVDVLLTQSGSGGYELVGLDTVSGSISGVVTTAVQQLALTEALAEAGTDPAAVAASVQIEETTLEPVDPNRGERIGVAIIGVILLFFSLSSYGQLVASGVVEEKQSRVVELLLATIRPWQLLAGKIIGLGTVGLIQLLILSALAVGAGIAFDLFALPTAALGMLVMVIVWFVIGFALYAALYAAIGSTVSRQEDLNSVVAPVIFLLIIPFIVVVNLLPNDPRSEIATVLSFIPFVSQTVMPARYAMGVAPLWEVFVSAAIAIAAIVVVVAVAARIYRNSVLRTGARVKLSEALRAAK